MTPNTAELDDDTWRDARRRLVDIGYRMLGSVAEAEDAADEACTRLLAADRSDIADPVGWLITVTGRLCLDRLRSADRSRRAYVGPWLPEPLLSLPDTRSADPGDRVTLDDSVRLALLVVLEQLSPAERTAFVLHDVFHVPFAQVGEIVGRSPQACRQLASRARRRIRSHHDAPRTHVDRGELERVARRFADACAEGRIEPLLELLDPDVVGAFDSGGSIPGAPLNSLTGADTIAATLVAAFAGSGADFGVGLVNGDPGVIVRRNGSVVAVVSLGVVDDRIDLIHAVGNPDKLPR